MIVNTYGFSGMLAATQPQEVVRTHPEAWTFAVLPNLWHVCEHPPSGPPAVGVRQVHAVRIHASWNLWVEKLGDSPLQRGENFTL